MTLGAQPRLHGPSQNGRIPVGHVRLHVLSCSLFHSPHHHISTSSQQGPHSRPLWPDPFPSTSSSGACPLADPAWRLIPAPPGNPCSLPMPACILPSCGIWNLPWLFQPDVLPAPVPPAWPCFLWARGPSSRWAPSRSLSLSPPTPMRTARTSLLQPEPTWRPPALPAVSSQQVCPCPLAGLAGRLAANIQSVLCPQWDVDFLVPPAIRQQT